MTREELIEIIENEVYIEDNHGSYHEIAGINDAADAILAKLEAERNVLDKANALAMQIQSEANQYWHERQ